ncbi:hypothetical protein SK128_023066 [Halocaridina rubra]|uniref:Fibronectin type-III domain-containing protein n=1 Tax=Halocaridina rubra TaxID=373956 RepID=A0AAN8XFQ5_HALRR
MTLLGSYQVHDPNYNYDIMNTNNKSFVFVHRITENNTLVLGNLESHALYTIGVVACLAPIRCFVPSNSAENYIDYVPCKLCSSVPAYTAAITVAGNTSDIIPEGSVKAEVENGTQSVKVSWLPPSTTNGDILSYHIEYTLNDVSDIILYCMTPTKMYFRLLSLCKTEPTLLAASTANSYHYATNAAAQSTSFQGL